MIASPSWLERPVEEVMATLPLEEYRGHMAAATQWRGLVVLVASVCVACSGDDDADNGGARTLSSDPYECGIVAKLEGGVQHTFGSEVECSGGPISTKVVELLGATFDEGSVELYFEFDPIPAEGQTGPVNVSRVTIGERVPNPSNELEPTTLYAWEAGPGACSMNIKSSRPDTIPGPLTWINAEGSCDQSLAPVPPNTKGPASVSPFSINTFIMPSFAMP